MKHQIAKLVRRFGYTIIPNWQLNDRERTAAMSRIFERFAIDTVLDVGANVGQFGKFLRTSLGYKGKIVSFEPIAELAEKCRCAAEMDGRWQVISCALGEEPGTLTINVMASPVFSSMLSPRHDDVPELETQNAITRSEIVTVCRLDDVLPPDVDLSRAYLKLDTQGFDLAVARGASKTLSRIPALQTEISFLPLYDGMPTYDQSIAYFQSRGFAVADMFRIGSDNQLRAFEFDCVMVRA